jgi:protein TonB
MEMKEIARPAEPSAVAPPPPPQKAEAPLEPTPPKTAAAPPRPEAPPATAATQVPPRPKAAREPAKPALAAARQGRREAPPGQTASLGAPNGGERLGRSNSDDTGGVINVNVNPRFRQPPPPPHYPKLSIERDEEGVVLVRALVDPSGAPQRVVIWKSSGYPLLDEAALKAVQGWRFEPMLREGRAIVSWVQVPVRFRLN